MPDTRPRPGDPDVFIRFDNVCKQYGELTVLDDLCLDIKAGEKVTLIGPSGSGKTTILRLLMTLENPTKGYIWIDGKPLWHQEKNGELVPADKKYLREARKQIGMVFQHFNLFPNMTVLENVIEAPVRSLGQPKDQAVERAKELLDRVGLAAKENAHPSQLSGGQQQRVAIARALAMEPRVLLLDEVTSALDPELVAGVLAVLRELAETTDITMLCVTHEMHFARDVSDCVMMFDKGKVVEQGPPSKIFDAPEHQRTKDFLSAISLAT